MIILAIVLPDVDFLMKKLANEAVIVMTRIKT
jgi:hypothetical protein